MYTSRMFSKGQVTIPKEVRIVLGLVPGDLVGFELEEGAVRLRRINPSGRPQPVQLQQLRLDS